jgi:hypothetical protein
MERRVALPSLNLRARAFDVHDVLFHGKKNQTMFFSKQLKQSMSSGAVCHTCMASTCPLAAHMCNAVWPRCSAVIQKMSPSKHENDLQGRSVEKHTQKEQKRSGQSAL